jgi:vitamin B12 transporter
MNGKRTLAYSSPFPFYSFSLINKIKMKKEKINLLNQLFISAVLLFGVCNLHAQQADSSRQHQLREIVVSATRSEQDPDSVGRSITVISNEEIKNSGANSLAEILSQQEEIYIVGTGQTPGQTQNIFMRGANSNQTSILIDGVRLTDPSTTDNAIDLSELSLANIERIEIVRGSHSTLYGSSAIGGVINIITKKGMATGVHADADLRAGEFGAGTSEFIENVFVNFTHKSGFYGSAEVYNNKTNGLDAVVDTVTDPHNYVHNHPDRDGFSKTDLMGKVGYRTEKLDLFAAYKHVDQKADIDAGAFQDDPAYTVAFIRDLFNWGAGYKINPNFSVLYSGGMTDSKRTAIDDSSIVDYQGNYNHSYFKGIFQGKTMTHDLQAAYKRKGISIVLGGNFFNEKMTANTSTYYFAPLPPVSLDSLHISVNTLSEFVHADLDGSLINNKLKIFALGLGMRNTQHDLFGNNLTYEVNPSIRLANSGLLYFSWSTGFNAPSLYQLYDPDHGTGSSITRGNPNLLPETSNSVEVGFKQKVNDRLSFHVAYFKTVVKNSIDYVYLWTKNKPVDSLSASDYKGDTYVNIGTQTNQGFEIGVNSKLSEKLNLGANISLISGRLDYDPASISNTHIQGNQVQLFANGAFINKQVQSFDLVRRPSTANINLSYKVFPKLTLRGDVRYVGPRNDVYYNSSLGPYGAQSTQGMGDYILVDISVRYRIIKGLTAGLKVENLFDEKYYEIYGYTTRGRGFYLSLRYSF